MILEKIFWFRGKNFNMKIKHTGKIIGNFGTLMDDALLVVDQNSTILEFNPACVRLLGENLKGTQLSNRLLYKNLLKIGRAHVRTPVTS